MPSTPGSQRPVGSHGGVPPLPVLPAYFRDEASRQRRVSALFDSTAGHYDWITNVMSLGSGGRYRRDALRRNGLAPGMHHLDVGAGTGAIALAGKEIVGPHGLALALDPSLSMLGVARLAGLDTLIAARGEDLPCATGSFDFLSMGFALRHVRDLLATFAEYARVLKPDGKVLLLEITRPPSVLAYAMLSFYLKRVVPTVAIVARRSADARTLMRFCWDTIEHCVPPKTILEALQRAGFVDVRRRIVLGVLSEYSARKPASRDPQV